MKQINFVEMSVICGGCEEAVLETAEVEITPIVKILPVVLEAVEEVAVTEEVVA
jgi:hypothetical protein